MEYIADLIGIRHLGLGYDFDDYLGREALGSFSSNLDSPSGRGISNEAEAGNLLKVLKGRGYTDEELNAVAYGNFFRVLKRCGNETKGDKGMRDNRSGGYSSRNND